MPVPDEGLRIIEAVKNRRYWDALGVSRRANSETIHDNHLRLCHKFRDSTEVIEALNRAKAEIREQKKTRHPPKVSLPFRQRVLQTAQNIINNLSGLSVRLPVLLLAITGTVYVLLNLHNIFLILLTLIDLIIFVRSIRKNDFNSKVYIVSCFILIWGGLSASTYLVLSKFTQIWRFLCVIIGFGVGAGLILYPFGPFMQGIYNRINRPSIFKSTGIFCVLFMLTFGLIYLSIGSGGEPTSSIIATKTIEQAGSVSQAAPSLTTAESVPKAAILKQTSGFKETLFLAIRFIAVISLLLFISQFFGFDWGGKLNNSSELYFCIMLISLFFFVPHIILEALYYVPVIGKYIGGDGMPRQISEPVFKHFSGFIIYNILVSFSSALLYLISIFPLTSLLKKITRKSYFSFSLNERICICAYITILAGLWVNVALEKKQWKIPQKAGYAGFIDSIAMHRVKVEEVESLREEIEEKITVLDVKPKEVFRAPQVKEEKPDARKEAVTLDMHGLKLVGIMFGEKDYLAIIEDSSGRSFLLKKGDNLNGSQIKNIEKDKLVLDDNGKEAYLLMQEPPKEPEPAKDNSNSSVSFKDVSSEEADDVDSGDQLIPRKVFSINAR